MEILQWWTPEGRYALILEAIKQLKALDFMRALASCLGCEGWRVEHTSSRIVFWDNGDAYERDLDWLLGCDFSDLPTGLRNDVEAIAASGDFCA